MTYKKVREYILANWFDADDSPKYTVDGDEETMVMKRAIEALEKQIPKTPNIYGDGYCDGELVYDMWECPNCGASYEIGYDRHKYCPNCGQAVDLSEV